LAGKRIRPLWHAKIDVEMWHIKSSKFDAFWSQFVPNGKHKSAQKNLNIDAQLETFPCIKA